MAVLTTGTILSGNDTRARMHRICNGSGTASGTEVESGGYQQVDGGTVVGNVVSFGGQALVNSRNG